MADEPMSDERLNEIRARAEAIRDWLLTPESDGKPHFPTSRRILGVDALALLAELERLRAENAALTTHKQVLRDWVVEVEARVRALQKLVDAAGLTPSTVPPPELE